MLERDPCSRFASPCAVLILGVVVSGCGVSVESGNDNTTPATGPAAESNEEYRLVADGVDSSRVPNGRADTEQVNKPSAFRIDVKTEPLAPVDVTIDVQCFTGSTNHRKQTEFSGHPPISRQIPMTIDNPDSCSVGSTVFYQAIAKQRGKITTRIYAKCVDNDGDQINCNDFSI